MLDQNLADAATEDHVEHALGHAGFLGGANHRIGHAFGSGHVAAVRLEHHRAAGRQGGRGVATSGGEGQGEVAGTKHGDRADADLVLAQIWARQRLAIRQGAVDTGTVEITPAQHLGEQAHLATCTTTFTLDAGSRQRGFTANQGDEVIAQGVDLVSDGLEELGTAHGRQAAVAGVSGSGSLGGGIDFFRRGLDEAVGQRFTAAGVEALERGGAGGAALTADVVVASQTQHGVLLSEGATRSPGTLNEARLQRRDEQPSMQLSDV